MAFKDFVKKMAGISDNGFQNGEDQQDYYDDEEYVDSEDDIYSNSQSDGRRVDYKNSENSQGAPASNIVGFNARNGHSQVTFATLKGFAGVEGVADSLKERKIVILNLEECKIEEVRRVIDYFSGVTYSLSGKFQRIAGRAYIITPSGVNLSGELLDQIEKNASK